MGGGGRWVGERGDWWPTFDAEFKNAKILNSHLLGGGAVGGQLLMPSPELLKTKIPIYGGGGRWVGERGDWWPTFDAESRNAKIPNSH